MIQRSEPLLGAERRRIHGPGPPPLRTVWISDIHMGTKSCKAAELVDFLDAHPCQRLYLVGDVVDGWKLGRGWRWSDAQARLLRRLLECIQRGVEVIYLPGNHDEALRHHAPLVLAGIRVRRQVVHELVDGRRALVLHGDQFDGVVSHHRRLALLGDRLYSLALLVNDGLNAVRRRLGRRPWHLSAYLKDRVKHACSYVSAFEEAVAREAGRWGVDAVICGHVHRAEMRQIGNVLYANDGDWVESCTGLVEHADGALELLRWDPEKRSAVRMAFTPGGAREPRGVTAVRAG
jgi:UDP-2,3-diacylglucosamine pyrophosphatase LpxH